MRHPLNCEAIFSLIGQTCVDLIIWHTLRRRTPFGMGAFVGVRLLRVLLGAVASATLTSLSTGVNDALRPSLQ